MTVPQAHKPLAGVRVIEMAQIMAGPICGMMLADLGAEVVKIEKFPGGDDARQYQKPGDSEMPPSFRMINRGKRSLSLDVRTPQGRAVLLRLVKGADVLTENFRPGVMERLGLGYEDLKSVNPALIYCSITGYGRTGPMAKVGGFDLILQAFSGIIAATGEPDRDPVKPGVSIADTNAGILAALAIVSAYVHRLKTGQGQHVGTSLLQAAMQQTYWLAANYFSSGRETQRLGTAHSLIAPYQVFKAGDGRMVIGAGNPKAWASACEVLGHPEWAADPRFDHPQRRVKNRLELETLIEAVLAEGPVAQWCARFEAAGVPAGPVNSAGQALEHAQVRAVGMVIDVPDGQGGIGRGIGTPITLDGKAEAVTAPAPRLGEHSRAVLRELGLGETEIDALVEARAVEQA
ncbi:MAG TPA: CaiB/BaiF CoA-transferase family protein [Burkholderiaceae bacterium]|nr:CaiB/BaiF CoA-transferase family protein [Burkholderiaceae bacterium]